MIDGFYLNYNDKHLYLLDSKRRPIECLTNLISNFNHINIFNSTGEMSFVIYYDDETKHIYDLFIENITHLRLEDYGEFVVSGTPETNEGEVRYKTVTCKDEEFMLNKRLLTLVNNSASFFSGVLWTTDTSIPCVMREFFKEVPSWSIGIVDEEIDTTKKSFRDIKKQNMLKFVYENIEEAFDCIPYFDSLNRTISFKKTKNAVDDTGIVLSFSNFIDSLTKESINDMFCTRMYVEGGNLDIRRVNADGRNYVYSYEKFYGLMSNSLSSGIQQWIATCDDNEEVYRTTFAEWSELQTQYQMLNAKYESLSPTNSELSEKWAYAIKIYGSDSTEAQVAEDNYWSWLDSSGFSGLYDQMTQSQTLANSKKTILDEINSICKISNFLTAEDLIELDQFETEGSYKQECFAYIKGMSEKDKGEISQLLKDYANEEIQRCNTPRYTWNVNLSNFCTIEGCEYFAENLAVGNYITLFDDITEEVIKLIVVKIETDKENPQDLKLSFSDRMTGHSYYPKLNELLNNAIKNMDDIETTNVRIDDLETEIESTNNSIDIVSSRVDYLYQNPNGSGFNIETYVSPNLETTSKNPIGAINEVFHSTSDAFNLFKTSILSKGGNVSDPLNKTNINNGILSIPSGGGKIEGVVKFIPTLCSTFFPSDKIYNSIIENPTPSQSIVYDWGSTYKDSLGYFEIKFNQIYPIKNKYTVDNSNEFVQYIDYSMGNGSKYVTRVYYTYSPITALGTVSIRIVDTTTNTVKVSEVIGTVKMVVVSDSQVRYDITHSLGNTFSSTHSVYLDGAPTSLSFKYANRWYTYQSPYCNDDIALDNSPFSGITNQILEVEGFIYTTGMTARKTYTIGNSINGLNKEIVAITNTIGVIIND